MLTIIKSLIMKKRLLFSGSAMLLLLGGHLNVQENCNNIDNRQSSNTSNNYITGGQPFGQTFKADASCLKGNAFSEISIRGNGNSSSRWDFSIYEGELIPTASYTPILPANGYFFSSRQLRDKPYG